MCAGLFRSALADKRGVAVVEMAMLAPVLALLLYGIIEISHFLVLRSKATATAQTIGDLAARETCITDVMVADMFRAGSLVLSPTSDVDAQFVLASIVFDKSTGVPVVVWKDVYHALQAPDPGMAGWAVGLGDKGESAIVVQTIYKYKPLFTSVLTSGFTFDTRAFERPRRTVTISRTNNC